MSIAPYVDFLAEHDAVTYGEANHDDASPCTGEEHEYEEAWRQVDVDRDVADGWRCMFCRARPPEPDWDGPYPDDF